MTCYHTWDSVWHDIHSQFYQKEGAGKRELYQEGVGNVRCLEEWAEELPAYPVTVRQPWFYSWESYSAFPILYKHSMTRAEHCYDFKLKISQLLRIQVLRDGVWSDSKREVHEFVNIEKEASLKTPELWVATLI